METRTYSSAEVCRLLGITYRTMDYAVRTGRVPGQPRIVGSGSPREWTEQDVADLRLLVEARRRAREILENPELALAG